MSSAINSRHPQRKIIDERLPPSDGVSDGAGQRRRRLVERCQQQLQLVGRAGDLLRGARVLADVERRARFRAGRGGGPRPRDHRVDRPDDRIDRGRGRVGGLERLAQLDQHRMQRRLLGQERVRELVDQGGALGREGRGQPLGHAGQSIGRPADPVGVLERTAHLGTEQELAGHDLHLQRHDVGNPLQVEDRALGEQTGLLDLAYGWINTRERIDPDRREQATPALRVGERSAADLPCVVEEAHERNTGDLGVRLAPLHHDREDFVLLFLGQELVG